MPGLGIVPREVIARMVTRSAPGSGCGSSTKAMVGWSTAASPATDRPPTVAQVRAQYVYSAGPGSQVLAGRTDTDHAVPYPDGPTAIGNLLPNDRTWHNGHTRQQLSVSVGDDGAVKWTSVLGQSRTVTSYDYRMHVAEEPEPGEKGRTSPGLGTFRTTSHPLLAPAR